MFTSGRQGLLQCFSRKNLLYYFVPCIEAEMGHTHVVAGSFCANRDNIVE